MASTASQTARMRASRGISAPRKPVLLGERKTGDARAVALSGNYAYVADGDKGLKVIDVSDAQSLPRVGALDTVDAQDLEVAGKYLLVADGPGGFKVFDISSRFRLLPPRRSDRRRSSRINWCTPAQRVQTLRRRLFSSPTPVWSASHRPR